MNVDRLERLTKIAGGRFHLTSLLQKRLAELVKGSPPMVDLPSNNLFEVAMAEIEEGRVMLAEPPPRETPVLAAPEEEEA